jgi:hypothetical protein
MAWSGEASEHEPNHGEMDIGDGEAGPVFEVLGEAMASTEPSEGSLDDPALGQHLEAFGLTGAFDDHLPRLARRRR